MVKGTKGAGRIGKLETLMLLRHKKEEKTKGIRDVEESGCCCHYDNSWINNHRMYVVNQVYMLKRQSNLTDLLANYY